MLVASNSSQCLDFDLVCTLILVSVYPMWVLPGLNPQFNLQITQAHRVCFEFRIVSLGLLTASRVKSAWAKRMKRAKLACNFYNDSRVEYSCNTPMSSGVHGTFWVSGRDQPLNYCVHTVVLCISTVLFQRPICCNILEIFPQKATCCEQTLKSSQYASRPEKWSASDPLDPAAIEFRGDCVSTQTSLTKIFL